LPPDGSCSFGPDRAQSDGGGCAYCAPVSNVSGDALTIMVGAAGIVASALGSWASFRRGERSAREQKKAFKELSETFKEYVAADIERARVAPVRSGSRSRSQTSAPPDQASSPSAPSPVERLVRASLGALVDERGDVQLPRLFGQVGSAMRSPHVSEICQTLQHLREAGSIDWEGPDDLNGVSIVRVLTPHRDSTRATNAGSQPGVGG